MGHEEAGEAADPLFLSARGALAQVLGVEAEAIQPETNIAEDLDADSLDMIEVAQLLEDEHDVKVDQKDLRGIKTVGDVVSYLGKLTGVEPQ